MGEPVYQPVETQAAQIVKARTELEIYIAIAINNFTKSTGITVHSFEVHESMNDTKRFVTSHYRSTPINPASS
jgi:hypothetical protein